MDEASGFSVRQFLRSREALLVHFNTPMCERHPNGFPGDLRTARTLAGIPISFSTIQATDRGPWQGGHPAYANAGGSVGLVVDIEDFGSVVSVGPHDDGTRAGTNGNHQTGGRPPSAVECARSIDERTTANEWFTQDFAAIGIFTFLPARVFVRGGVIQGEKDSSLEEVAREFPDDRIFSVNKGRFIEFDRLANEWRPVPYDAIVPADPGGAR